MSNYVKATDFQAKDALITGNPAKIIKGQEINDEFNSIQTAIATKADLASPAFTGNPTATTQSPTNSSTRLATTAFVASALALSVYPIGSIYLNATNSTNPATLLGFGTWVAFGAGRMPVGFDSTDTLFDTPEETGGSKDAVVVAHTHTANPITGTVQATSNDDDNRQFAVGFTSPTGIFTVSGTRTTNAPDGYGDVKTISNTTLSLNATPTINNSGVTETNANLPPYIVVFMWKRTA